MHTDGARWTQETELSEKGKKIRRGKPLAIIAAAILILALASRYYFAFLDTQLFEERKIHLVEFTDKASEIVDGIIDYSWQQLFACKYIVETAKIASDAELLDVLAATFHFLDGDSLVLAMDENGNYYSSDYHVGRWAQTELLTAKMGSEQQLVAEIPHKGEDSYLIFMKQLDAHLAMGDGGAAITHLALAVNISAMQEKISVSGFGNQCYTYLVNKDGRRLYKYTYANNFIEGYNVLHSFREYEIVHGGTYEGFLKALGQGESTALEFEFVGEDGSSQNWFVANAAISSENWQIFLFVPTSVLGVNTTLLMNRTFTFFTVFAVVFIGLVAAIIVNAMVSRADKRLLRQKDEANRLLKASAEEARSANRAKSDFLSHMSHDIRTPINGIMGMTDIALKNIGNQDKVLDCLNKISGSSQHLLGLINDVLDMSRIESGKTKVNHESFHLISCIDNCASIIAGQLATRDVALVKEVEEFEHPFLIGDELHLRQVFINILGNSVKFTPDGGKIYFRAAEIEHREGRAFFRFELEDTGIGMKEEFVPHLFEAFSQEDDGMRTTYKGTGLGMAITKQFLDLMGATVEVESVLNVGTKFTIELWIDIDTDAKKDVALAEGHVDLTGMSVLLVEDLELNLEIAQSILEEEGIRITPAVNGQEAVDAFASHPAGTFDAILMDIMMPVMDGITATKTIRAMEREDAKTIPIIAMTANAYAEDIRNTREAGMDAHLSKPIDVEKLLKTISHFYCMQKNRKKWADLNGKRFLVADDVELNREIAEEVLKEAGVTVVAAKDGKEALECFLGQPEGTFDVILMDVHMPLMDGLEATKAIRASGREDAKKLPIIAMTADVYEEDMQKTKAAGMDGHLAKPLDVGKMQCLLVKLLA